MLTRSLAAVLVLSALACQGEARVEAAASAEPATETYGFSFAIFRDDKLDHCADYYATAKPGSAGLLAAQAARMAETTQDATTPGEPLRLTKGCDEQFVDRPILASCVMRSPKASGGLAFAIRYYDIRSIDGSDADMNSCLSMGADWRASTDPAVVPMARFHEAAARFQEAVARSHEAVRKAEKNLADAR
jgi:hypothetical protein